MTRTATRLLEGNPVARQIRREVAAGVEHLVAAGGRRPGLTAVLVGDDPASHAYVASKAKACREVGIEGRTSSLPGDVSEGDLLATVEDLNRDDAVDGILVQLPLPSGLSERRILEEIDPAKDVDGFHPVNVGRLWLGQEGFVPATPAGILELLRRSEIPLVGLRAVIVGRSNIVGKPLAGLLLAEHCTVTVCHSRTRNLAALCRRADLLVAAIGRPGMITDRHVKEGAVVVDVGINRLTDRAAVEQLFPEGAPMRAERLARFDERGSIVVGDVDFARVAPLATAITPVPGGVGPLTVAMLLANTLTAARQRQGIEDDE